MPEFIVPARHRRERALGKAMRIDLGRRGGDAQDRGGHPVPHDDRDANAQQQRHQRHETAHAQIGGQQRMEGRGRQANQRDTGRHAIGIRHRRRHRDPPAQQYRSAFLAVERGPHQGLFSRQQVLTAGLGLTMRHQIVVGAENP